MSRYAHPEMLVETDWVASHLNDKNLRVIEVDVDTTQYEKSHVRLMNGGRKKWLDEKREMTTNPPSHAPATYKAKSPDPSLRALREQVMQALTGPKHAFVDVRSPREFSGELLAPPGLNETAQRGGHIPGAKSIPWAQAVQENGTFKSVDDLKKLYEPKGVSSDKDVITYCRIGERSSHTWFVLKYLLGYPNVRNYDGSWTEWGSIVNAPIEKGT